MNKKALVRETIHSLISKEEKRKNYLRILLEVIRLADSYGKNKWGVHCREHRIRLLIGRRIVFTIEEESLWLALEQRLTERYSNILENNESWKWDTKDYPEYKSPPSKNGYYFSPNLEDWSQIKHIHFEYIKLVSQMFQQLDIRSQQHHEPEVLNYLRKELHEAVPEPIYNGGLLACLPEEIEEEKAYYEGARKIITVNAYERNPEARLKCIEYYGTNCEICGLNFEDTYGEIGKGFIHVHHVIPLSEIAEEYTLDPIQDLRPVCPNCHAMLHKGRPCYTLDELKQIMSTSRVI